MMANSWANCQWGAAGVLDIFAAWNRALVPHAVRLRGTTRPPPMKGCAPRC